MRRRHTLLLTLVLSVLTTGCMRTNILEQTALIVMAGYDDAGKDGIRGLALLYQVDPRAKEKTQVIASNAESSKGTREINNFGLPKSLVSGQLRVVLYSESLVRQRGLLEMADTMSRDSNVGRMIYVAICKGRAEDIMSYRYPETSNVGTFLYQDIRQNTIGGKLPSSTLHEFIRDYYEPGRDPVMPIIEKRENKITITGLALFRNDRMVAELGTRDGFYIKTFRDRHAPMNLQVIVPNEEVAPYFLNKPKLDALTASFSTLKEKSSIRLVDPEQLKFQVRMDIRAELLEVSERYDLSDPKAEQALAQAISRKMSAELTSLLKHTIALRADAFSLGEHYRSAVRNSHLTPTKWHDMMKDAKVDAKVNLTIVRSGIVE